MSAQRDTVVVADVARRWALARPRLWDRLVVRWQTLTLDAQLAAGKPVEADRRRALRATLLVARGPGYHRPFGGNTGRGGAGRVRTGTGLRIPLQRSRVLAADADIRRLIVALRASAPVPARGVAIARMLLNDGTGPLYNARSTLPLGAAVRDAIRHLNPSAELLTYGY
jgi:hypothetical protein